MIVLVRDLRYAIRRLLRRPAYTAIVVFSLALGIGANTMVFSLANALLWSAVPYPHPDRVVVVWFTPPEDPGARILATDANCAALRDRARSFQHLGCVLPDVTTNLADITDSAGATRLAGQEFTTGVADALGLRPILGRWFTPDEERRAEPVVVISHRLWQRRFRGDPNIIGRQVRATNQRLTSEVVTIVGVAPEAFQFFNARTDYWLPFPGSRDAADRATRRLIVVGRLNPGVTLRQAQLEMDAAAIALARETPFTNKGWGTFVETVQETLERGIGQPLLILQGVVAFVLLIACGNVAGLLLAEGVSRKGEMALRLALGAGRGRIVGQWLTEAVVTSALGAVLGLSLAFAGLRVLLASLPPGLPGVDAVTLNPVVLTFTAVVSVMTAVIFGIAPALRVSRLDPSNALKGSSRQAGRGSGRQLRSAFVVVQIALAVVLSIGSGLMIHSLIRLRKVDIGVDPEGLMTFQVQLDGRNYVQDTGYRTPSGAPATEITPRLVAAGEQIRQRLSGISGIRAASAMSATAPLSGVARTYAFGVSGGEASRLDSQQPVAEWFAVLHDYFRTLGVPLVKGRDFNDRDSLAGLPVAVINRSLADELWPGGDPIGREVQLRLFNDPPRQVVGVVADVRQSTQHRGPLRQIYVPLAQLRAIQSGVVAQDLGLLTYVVRFEADAATLPAVFRDVVAEVDPAKPVTNVQPLQQYVSQQLAGFRQYAMLLTVFGTAAVALAVVGTYGLMAHMVGQRVNEIGIRMALGATPGQVLWLVLRRGVALSAIGLFVGIAASLSLARLLASFLWEVGHADPATFSIVPAVVAAVSLLACYTAARRAVMIDPAAAIRQQ